MDGLLPVRSEQKTRQNDEVRSTPLKYTQVVFNPMQRHQANQVGMFLKISSSATPRPISPSRTNNYFIRREEEEISGTG